jgi:hypothetical protein
MKGFFLSIGFVFLSIAAHSQTADSYRIIENRNGKLDRYEDWRLSAEERASDLARKMTVEQKKFLKDDNLRFACGLNWKGVIRDARTAKYGTKKQ